MERINLNKDQYDLIISKFVFNEKKKEYTIFNMAFKGYTIREIAQKTSVSERTIYRRLNILEYKINYFLNEHDMYKNNYFVYIHKFPNNKVYIGITNNINQRWQNGLGYQDNKKMFNDILYYGWNNIKHIIIAEGLTYLEAVELETKKIKEYNSYNKQHGYNVRV